jgi:hypothetical protein
MDNLIGPELRICSESVAKGCDAADLDGGQEGIGAFGIASGDAAPLLQMQEGVFRQAFVAVKGPAVRGGI